MSTLWTGSASCDRPCRPAETGKHASMAARWRDPRTPPPPTRFRSRLPERQRPRVSARPLCRSPGGGSTGVGTRAGAEGWGEARIFSEGLGQLAILGGVRAGRWELSRLSSDNGCRWSRELHRHPIAPPSARLSGTRGLAEDRQDAAPDLWPPTQGCALGSCWRSAGRAWTLGRRPDRPALRERRRGVVHEVRQSSACASTGSSCRLPRRPQPPPRLYVSWGSRLWQRLRAQVGRISGKAPLQGRARRGWLRPLRFHDLRHSFGSQLAAAGVDQVTIQAAMGRGVLATTGRHLHARDASAQAETFTRAFATGIWAPDIVALGSDRSGV